LDHSWTQEIDYLNKGMERLQTALRKLKEYASTVIFLLGTTDLRPDFSEDICSALDVVQLTERVDEVYGSGLFEGKGYSMISWGPGSGVGGIRGFAEELKLQKRNMFPQSMMRLNSQHPEPINPVYSGILFYKTFEEKLKKSNSQKKIVVSHMPPYMGNDIDQLSNPRTTNKRLDKVILSAIRDVNYSKPTHVGDIFFRMALNKNSNRGILNFIHSVYFGHIEEGKGESCLNHTYMRNLGSFDEDLFVVEL